MASDGHEPADLATEELNRIGDRVAERLKQSSGEREALKPEEDNPTVAAVKASPMGQAAAMISALTGLPPKAVFVVLLLIGLQTGYVQQYFPSLNKLDKTATEVAEKEAVEEAKRIVAEDGAKMHLRLNNLDQQYRAGCESQQADIEKLAKRTLYLEGQIARLNGLRGLPLTTPARREDLTTPR